MDDFSQKSRHDVAYRILSRWGMIAQQRAKLLGDQEHVKAVLSIAESPHAIFSDDEDRATQWSILRL